METVNNLASQASKYLFGGNEGYDPATDSGQEPRSGETGDVRRGEPYDAGNKDEPGVDNTGAIDSNPSTSDSKNNSSSLISDDKNASKSDNINPTGSKQAPQRDLDPKEDVSSGTTGTGPNVDPATASRDTPGNVTSVDDSHGDDYANKINSASRNDQSANKPPNDPPSNAADNTGDKSVGDPSSGNQVKQKQQGADRPGEAPSGDKNDAVKDTKQDAEDAQDVDVSGPGPMLLEERAKQGGGDAAAAPGGGNGGGGSGGDGDDDKPQSESHGEGTGEKYIKSSGMKVDGGDFDAANAGAGKEADRLLEEKGVHHGEDSTEQQNNDEPSQPSQDSSADKNGKRGFAEKIKSKFHKH